ncbi:MAG: hypothetical protein LBG90_08530 [Spirochaetaceae bacterium]|jgi:predicted DNA-binding protein YlxM (UPF0122 family)|nr:hypothetical protein [Spirochaetaceae bacterium]
MQLEKMSERQVNAVLDFINSLDKIEIALSVEVQRQGIATSIKKDSAEINQKE